MRSLYVFPFLALVACSSPADDSAAPSPSGDSSTATSASSFELKAGKWRRCSYDGSGVLDGSDPVQLTIDGDVVRVTSLKGTYFEGPLDKSTRQWLGTYSEPKYGEGFSERVSGAFTPAADRFVGQLELTQNDEPYQANALVYVPQDGTLCPEHQ